ncbi:MAG: VOC family protein [Leptolyngbyaceae cyanobacterium]
MTRQANVGQIVWHDLLTPDVTAAMHFYAELLGWQYQIEHSTDFVWHSGAADYPLILAHGAAHGGFVEMRQNSLSGWIAYIQVAAVDAITVKAKELGASVERTPFDIPGVGRSAVIRDLQGAVICPTVPTYSFPTPSGTFLRDELNTADVEIAKAFYRALFSESAQDADGQPLGQFTLFDPTDNHAAVGIVRRSLATVNAAIWLPYLAINDLNAAVDRAQTLGANVILNAVGQPGAAPFAILTDPQGAVFGLSAP